MRKESENKKRWKKTLARTDSRELVKRTENVSWSYEKQSERCIDGCPTSQRKKKSQEIEMKDKIYLQKKTDYLGKLSPVGDSFRTATRR